VGYAELVTTPAYSQRHVRKSQAGPVCRVCRNLAREARAQRRISQARIVCRTPLDGLFLSLFSKGKFFPTRVAMRCCSSSNELIPGSHSSSWVFKLGLKGLRPIVAHPERYAPLFKRTDPSIAFSIKMWVCSSICCL